MKTQFHTTTKQSVFLLLIISLLLATSLTCSSGAGGPTSTSNKLLTSEQISKIQLESLLVQAGDLPTGYVGSTPSNTVPARYKSFPVAQNQISEQITSNGSWVGDVNIFLYTKQADIDKAIQPSTKDATNSNTLPGLGEKSVFLVFSIPFGTGGGTIDGADALFVRCSAVVDIRLITDNKDNVSAYAKRLDSRLTPVVCNNP